jgi:hypothetical protein
MELAFKDELQARPFSQPRSAKDAFQQGSQWCHKRAAPHDLAG